jgi:hypothetical protein
MNEQLDYCIVQFLGPGEADRPSLQPFETRPEVEIMPVLRQNPIPMPNASHWSHNSSSHVISGFPKLLKLKVDEVLAKDNKKAQRNIIDSFALFVFPPS